MSGDLECHGSIGLPSAFVEAKKKLWSGWQKRSLLHNAVSWKGHRNHTHRPLALIQPAWDTPPPAAAFTAQINVLSQTHEYFQERNTITAVTHFHLRAEKSCSLQGVENSSCTWKKKKLKEECPYNHLNKCGCVQDKSSILAGISVLLSLGGAEGARKLCSAVKCWRGCAPDHLSCNFSLAEAEGRCIRMFGWLTMINSTSSAIFIRHCPSPGNGSCREHCRPTWFHSLTLVLS